MLDPVVLALTQKRLDHISHQMGWVMIRTSNSPIFNQSHDFSCFLANSTGEVISQADGIPIHTGGGGFAVRAMLRDFGARIEPGDLFILNDPYVAGGNHLPDWVVIRPAFVDGRVFAFTCIRAHQSDIGGGAAGTYNSAATEIFHEGIRLPVMRLVERGEVRTDLWQMLMINSRTPHLLDGDLRAMLGGTQVGAEQIVKLVEDIGPEVAGAYFSEILDHADRRLRAIVAEVPDGVYVAQECYEDDCFEEKMIPIRVSLTVKGDRLAVDFSGSAPQIKGFKNSTLANTHSAVYTAVASFFDANMPRNEGAFRSIEINAPLGTVINARPPAACTFCTSNPAHQIIQAVWRALGEAVPDNSCAGWGNKAFPVTSGYDDSKRTFVLYHWGANSGGGAVAGRDGLNQIGPLETLGGLIIPNVEAYEQMYPVRVLKQEFRCDSGGAGKYRGGTGVHYIADLLVPADYAFRAEGVLRPKANGVNGGLGGGMGKVEVHIAGGESFVPPTYAVTNLPPLRLEIRSPGGGGWGEPRDRDQQKVIDDVRDGLVSPSEALRIYGLVSTTAE